MIRCPRPVEELAGCREDFSVRRLRCDKLEPTSAEFEILGRAPIERTTECIQHGREHALRVVERIAIVREDGDVRLPGRGELEYAAIVGIQRTHLQYVVFVVGKRKPLAVAGQTPPAIS